MILNDLVFFQQHEFSSLELSDFFVVVTQTNKRISAHSFFTHKNQREVLAHDAKDLRT